MPLQAIMDLVYGNNPINPAIQGGTPGNTTWDDNFLRMLASRARLMEARPELGLESRGAEMPASAATAASPEAGPGMGDSYLLNPAFMKDLIGNYVGQSMLGTAKLPLDIGSMLWAGGKEAMAPFKPFAASFRGQSPYEEPERVDQEALAATLEERAAPPAAEVAPSVQPAPAPAPPAPSKWDRLAGDSPTLQAVAKLITASAGQGGGGGVAGAAAPTSTTSAPIQAPVTDNAKIVKALSMADARVEASGYNDYWKRATRSQIAAQLTQRGVSSPLLAMWVDQGPAALSAEFGRKAELERTGHQQSLIDKYTRSRQADAFKRERQIAEERFEREKQQELAMFMLRTAAGQEKTTTTFQQKMKELEYKRVAKLEYLDANQRWKEAQKQTLSARDRAQIQLKRVEAGLKVLGMQEDIPELRKNWLGMGEAGQQGVMEYVDSMMSNIPMGGMSLPTTPRAATPSASGMPSDLEAAINIVDQ